MVAQLRTVVLKGPAAAYRSTAVIDQEWQALNYSYPPALDQAMLEHQQFASLLKLCGVRVHCLPGDSRTGLDSIYTHDPVLMTNSGAIILQAGKKERLGEGPAFADALKRWNVPILGSVNVDGTVEGGDLIWLDSSTLIVGRSYRTNDAGIKQLKALLQVCGVSTIVVDLPHWEGPQEVLHLQSFISLLDDDLALIHSRLMPVALYEILNDRGIKVVNVSDGEFKSLGCNVLTVSPRKVLMLIGNPITRSLLKEAGCQISEFTGNDICLPGSGGPTCLVQPLLRE